MVNKMRLGKTSHKVYKFDRHISTYNKLTPILARRLPELLYLTGLPIVNEIAYNIWAKRKNTVPIMKAKI